MRRLDRLCAGLHAGPIQVLRTSRVSHHSENRPCALRQYSKNKSNSLPKYTQTDFAIFVEIWIEANLAVVCGHKLDARSMYRVVGRTAYYKVKKSTFVRRIKWTSDESVQLHAEKISLFYCHLALSKRFRQNNFMSSCKYNSTYQSDIFWVGNNKYSWRRFIIYAA